MIDAAIAAGIKFIIPAKFIVETRNPIARRLPILASVIDIQDYLATREDQVEWCVINCGACIEFVSDLAFIVDFQNRLATLWDGGEGRLSLGTISIAAKAVAGVLKAPEKFKTTRFMYMTPLSDRAKSMSLLRASNPSHGHQSLATRMKRSRARPRS